MKRSLSLLLCAAILLLPLSGFGFYEDFVGKEVSLRPYFASGLVYIGMEKEAFNALTSNLMGKDKEAYYTWILAHEGFEVYEATKARVLDVSFYEQAAKVKILEGTHRGEEGWVLLEQAVRY
ncbi:MAG: hypothetical protein GF333_03865 [Candidatus Omnitrophica bacterium]|nr:hypothetical protein [Candidatus Omnitrophota bacterium]